MVNDGHEVAIWTEMPTYNRKTARNDLPVDESLDGIFVRRLHWIPGWSKSSVIQLVSKATFPLRILVQALKCRCKGHRYDLVISATIPPVANGFFGLMSARILRAKFIYHMQDIYPEIGVHAGSWSEGGLAYRILMIVERFTCSRADKIVVLSEDMLASLEMRGINRDKVSIINNFELDDFERSDISEKLLSKNSGVDPKFFNILFSGNIGRFQNLESVVECARRVSDIKDLRIVLMGEGAIKEKLKTLSDGIDNVVFLPYQPYSKARFEIAKADLGLVTLQKGIYKYAYPSKTFSYLGLGVPVLVIAEEESELSRFVRSEAIGFAVADSSILSIEKAIREAYSNRKCMDVIRRNVRVAYRSKLSRGSAMGKWSDLISMVGV